MQDIFNGSGCDFVKDRLALLSTSVGSPKVLCGGEESVQKLTEVEHDKHIRL